MRRLPVLIALLSSAIPPVGAAPDLPAASGGARCAGGVTAVATVGSEGRAVGPVLWPNLAFSGEGPERSGPRGVVLTGVVLPASAGDEAVRDLRARLAGLAGAVVRVRGQAAGRDRRERIAGQVEVAGAAPGWLQQDLVAEGLAIADGLGEDCAPLLAEAEAAARAARRGLWAGGGPMVDANDFRDAILPDFVVLEGRVDTVGETGSTTYLNFGGAFARDASVRIDRRTSAALVAERQPSVLTGRRVRVRGWAEPRDGLDIRLAAPAALEVIEEQRARPR